MTQGTSREPFQGFHQLWRLERSRLQGDAGMHAEPPTRDLDGSISCFALLGDGLGGLVDGGRSPKFFGCGRSWEMRSNKASLELGRLAQSSFKQDVAGLGMCVKVSGLGNLDGDSVDRLALRL